MSKKAIPQLIAAILVGVLSSMIRFENSGNEARSSDVTNNIMAKTASNKPKSEREREEIYSTLTCKLKSCFNC